MNCTKAFGYDKIMASSFIEKRIFTPLVLRFIAQHILQFFLQYDTERWTNVYNTDLV